MFYLLDKQKGISSFKAIKKFAKENEIKKIGHTGTLDPLATGLLLIATDADTKLIEYVDKGFKKYRATMILGKVSNTYDIEGDIQEVSNDFPTREKLESVIFSFLEKKTQMPPIFSAKKINGIRAYDLARKGSDVKLKPINVEFKNIKLLSYKNDEVVFDVVVSRGTYIRSLIHDIGDTLSCGAIMTELRRTEIGNLSEDNLNKEVNIEKIFTLDIITLENITDIKHGKTISCDYPNGKYGIKYNNEIIGIATIFNKILKTNKLLGNKL